MVPCGSTAGHHLLRRLRPALVLLGHTPVVHPEIRRLFLLVDACFRCRSRRCRSIAVHWARRISYADQALRRSFDSGRAPSGYDIRIRYYCVSSFDPLEISCLWHLRSSVVGRFYGERSACPTQANDRLLVVPCWWLTSLSESTVKRSSPPA